MASIPQRIHAGAGRRVGDYRGKRMNAPDPRIPETDLRCPDCGSGDVEPYAFDSQPWMCNKCGWAGDKDELKREEK